MWRRHKPLLAFLSLLLSAPFTCAMAVEQIARNKLIETVDVYLTYAIVRYAPPQATTECSGPSSDSAVIIDWSADPDVKTMYATALVAYMTGEQVGFGVHGCHPSESGTPNAYRIDIQN